MFLNPLNKENEVTLIVLIIDLIKLNLKYAYVLIKNLKNKKNIKPVNYTVYYVICKISFEQILPIVDNFTNCNNFELSIGNTVLVSSTILTFFKTNNLATHETVLIDDSVFSNVFNLSD